MRIAHFVHRYPPALGGSESYFARLSRYLANRGDSVSVFTTNALDLEAFWSAKARRTAPGDERQDSVLIRRYPIRYWPGQRYWLKLLSFVPVPTLQCRAVSCNPIAPGMWADAGRREKPGFSEKPGFFDVVHATAFPYTWPILCGLRLARRCQAPFVLTPFVHLGDPRNPHDRTRRAYLSRPMQYLLRSADAIFVQTELECNAIAECGIPPKQLILLGMGVDTDECTGGNRQEARQRWGIGPDEIVIGHLANKSVEKGTVDLLEAARQLAHKGRRVRLVLAGPEMPNFVDYWRALTDTSNVVRLGILHEAEKRDFFSVIDIFALPSRSDSFGIVLLEAWANGVPCVAYRAGGVAEVIRHGEDGLLVDCGDVAGLGKALQTLTVDDELRRRLGASGKEKVSKDYRWGPRLELVRQTYRRLIDEKTTADQRR